MNDPRDDFANKPDRNPDITTSGQGAPPADLSDFDRPDVVYRELFSTAFRPRNIRAAGGPVNVWLKA